MRTQSIFLAAAAFATFARIQYAALVIAVALAAAIVERGHPGALVRRHALLVGAPLAGAAAIMVQGGLGRLLEGVLSFRISTDTVGWLPVSAVLLAVATGIIIVPGAVVWTVSQMIKPTTRARLAFAAVGALSLTMLIVAAALFASETGSNRFFERYLMIGIPVAAVAFCCWIAEARPLRGIAVAVAAFLVIAAARVPISEYAVGQGMADSPLLLAVNRLDGAIGVGNASLLVAVAVTTCAVIAAATAMGKVESGGALAATAVVLMTVSVGAHAADRQHSAYIVSDVLHAAPDWIDQAGAKDVLLLEPSGNNPEAAMLLALRNSSIGGIVLLGSHAQQFDGASRRLMVDDQGTLRLGSDPIRQQLLLDGTSTRIIVVGGRTIRQGGDFTLLAPRDDPRLGVTVDGLYADGWLAGSGSMTIYATGRPGLCRNATLHLTLPGNSSHVRIAIAGDGGRQSIDVTPRSTRNVSISGSSIHRTTVSSARRDSNIPEQTPRARSLGEGTSLDWHLLCAR